MISCLKADLTDPEKAKLMVEMLNAYASDPMGGNDPLSRFTKDNLVKQILKRPHGHVFMAYLDGTPARLAICFEGFSTFACAPLVNIHDLAVLPAFRWKGIGSSLLMYVEQFARSINCCKPTLEVLEWNYAAKACYTDAGFQPYELDPDVGSAMFWQKKIG